jgi:hypothetical protein
VKNPAENIWAPGLLDLRFSVDEVVVDATAQLGSLLLKIFTEHSSIFLTSLLTEKGKRTSNFPSRSVFTRVRKFGFVFVLPQPTSTNAPEMKWLVLEKS